LRECIYLYPDLQSAVVGKWEKHFKNKK
jgi:hypothetical protein